MEYIGLIWQVLKYLLQLVLPYLKSVAWSVWAYLRSVFKFLKGLLSPYLVLVFKCQMLLFFQLMPSSITYRILAKYVDVLREAKVRVQHVTAKVKVVEGKYFEEVMKWSEEVDGVISKYEDFMHDEEYRQYGMCSEYYLPKPGVRFGLSIEMTGILWRIFVLLNESKIWSNLGLSAFVKFSSRLRYWEDIVAALADSSVRMIQVYGKSGVGKSSLISSVASKARQDKMFDKFFEMEFPNRPDIRAIQEQLASWLGMKLKEESETTRAALIRESLNNLRVKTLIIIDNVRVKLDFNMLGIPFKNLNSDDSCKNLKFLIIFHSKQLLLRRVMDGNGIKTFCVKSLTEKEAETMFKTVAEIGDGINPRLEALAARIAKMCNGLPITIVTTAKELKNKSLYEWHDAYEKLERQNLSSAKRLIDDLETEELKQTFLISACMGGDALISDLVRYCIGLGLLKEFYTVKEARERVHVLVEKLKELNLLSDSFSSDRFTMEDTIRDAALSITSQKIHAFAVIKRKLDEWPEKEKLKRYSAIFLMHCDVTHIMKEFPERMNCFKLKVFHLDNKDPCLRIPDNFFSGMKELRVLILVGIHLSPLPSSVKCLKQLRMLCLERCKLGEHLSIIGELEKLRILSLSGSHTERLPAELRQLAELQIFDISNCFKLEEIPAGVLSSLTGLEELYVGNSPIQWKDEEGKGNQSGNASLSELRQLNQLMTLDIQIPKITQFPKKLFFDKLDSYKIIISDNVNAYTGWDFKMLETCEVSRYLALQLEKGLDIHHQKQIKILFERVENLLLGQLTDVEDILSELNYEGFPYLKYLSIVSNSKVKSIVNSEDPDEMKIAFPELESLFLYEVNNMEHIHCRSVTRFEFYSLKTIKLKICGQLKNVFFSDDSSPYYYALETIEVSECNSFKEIVTLQLDHLFDWLYPVQIKFPNLRSLTLHSLPEFIGFYTLGGSRVGEVINLKPNELFDEKLNMFGLVLPVVVSKLERLVLSSIKIQNIWSDRPLTRPYFQNLIHLDVNDCWNLKYLLSFSMSKSLMNLQSLSVSECGMMKSIFKETEDSVIEIEHQSIFPELKIINLKSMKRLTSIWAKFHRTSFGKLDTLIIEGCNKLENVFPSDMIVRFQSLCNLKVNNCKLMKELFEHVHVEALPKLKHAWKEKPKQTYQNRFTCLKKIWVQECQNLKHIFPVSIDLGHLDELEYLEVCNCEELEEIVSREETLNGRRAYSDLPKLTTIRFSKLPNLRSFYGGEDGLSRSIFNLFVEQCPKFRLFGTEIANPEIESFILKVIGYFKSVHLESRDANDLKRYMGKDNQMYKLEELQLSQLVHTEILYFFLHRNPNLESLLLSNCFFEQLVPPSGVNDSSVLIPKLKSLKLMNLPSLKMIGFEEYAVLFRMLECLVIKDCPCLNTIAPSSVSFTYLTNLEVSNCNKLSYLMTPSTAKSLVHLTTMKVIQCESMKAIVSVPENEEQVIIYKEKMETKVQIIFRQLKEIKLVALESLESFCSSVHYVFEFTLLEKFVVSECGHMKTFTSSEKDKAPILQQVCVGDETEEKIYYWKYDLNSTMQHIYHIQALDPYKTSASHPYTRIESSRLKTLKLANCELGSHAIPTDLFSSLKNLGELEVSNTNVEVIFDIMEAEMKGYTFPLKKVTLDNLPNLTRVWDKDSQGILSFQNLQEVIVTNCMKLKTLFPTELAESVVAKLKKLEVKGCEMLLEIVEEENANTEATKEFSFPHLTSLDLRILPQLTCFYHGKAIFSLESLKVDWKNTLMLCNGNFAEDMLHELVKLELDFGDVNEVWNFPVQILEKAFNLEYLQISRCRGLTELFHSQHEHSEIRTHGHFITLSLVRLQKLYVSWCPHLTTLVHSHSAVSFSNLKQLSVNDCQGLKYLFTSSTARMLVHLEEMYIVRCEALKQILANDLETFEAITLERLNTIVLDSLPSLLCFYSGIDTLLLSPLIKVLIWKCPSMKFFSQEGIHVQSILRIQISLDPTEDLLFHQDLNTTVNVYEQQEFIEALDERFSIDHVLQESWAGIIGPQIKWLNYLVSLKLDKFTVPCAIPSGILPYLNNLQELEVWDSDIVEVIFEMHDTEIMETASQLKKLTLHGLSKLLQVWEKNSEGVLIFRNLQEVVVSDCRNLQTLFSASLGKSLDMLEKLKIESCDKLQEIVEKEQVTTANVSEKFVFPCLETLDLFDLPQVTCFYPQTFTLECPALKILSVLNCHELELFQSAHPMGEGTSINRQTLISNLKVISDLKELRLDWKHISALSLSFISGQFMEGLHYPTKRPRLSKKNFLQGLRYLNKISLIFDVDENEDPFLPIEILQNAPNLTERSIEYCNSPEIFLPNIVEEGMLGQLKILTLWKVSALQSMESEDSSWLNTICEKLHELNVDQCPHLRTVAHTVSFSCLKRVAISNCPDLQYLFTYSAAEKLMNLEEITVEDCESMKEIVAEEGDEDEPKGEGEDKYENEKIFRKLKILTLGSLPKFESFYMGKSTLNFPSLKVVWFTRCYNTKLFCLGDKVPGKLEVIIDGVRWEGDINSVIMQQLDEESA